METRSNFAPPLALMAEKRDRVQAQVQKEFSDIRKSVVYGDYLSFIQRKNPGLYQQIMDAYELKATQNGFDLIEKEDTEAQSWRLDLRNLLIRTEMDGLKKMTEGVIQRLNHTDYGRIKVEVTHNPGTDTYQVLLIDHIDHDRKMVSQVEGGKWQIPIDGVAPYTSIFDAVNDTLVLYRMERNLKAGQYINPDPEDVRAPFYLNSSKNTLKWSQDNAVDPFVGGVRSPAAGEKIRDLGNLMYRQMVTNTYVAQSTNVGVSEAVVPPEEVVATESAHDGSYESKGDSTETETKETETVAAKAQMTEAAFLDSLRKADQEMVTITDNADGSMTFDASGLNTLDLVRVSRIQHMVAPEGKPALKNIPPAEIETYKIEAQEGPYTWQGDTWKNAAGKRLLIGRGYTTEFKLVKEGAPTMASAAPAGVPDAAADAPKEPEAPSSTPEEKAAEHAKYETVRADLEAIAMADTELARKEAEAKLAVTKAQRKRSNRDRRVVMPSFEAERTELIRRYQLNQVALEALNPSLLVETEALAVARWRSQNSERIAALQSPETEEATALASATATAEGVDEEKTEG